MQRGWAQAALAVARRPSLWGAGARQVRVLARPGWWRHRPFLPLPDPAYLRFRMQTAYGDAGGQPPVPSDLVAYLHWARDYPRAGSDVRR
ncbi:MAG: hypothetical protein JWO68_3126 [Actinomycetia bacterium]|nr:hypothetical protein [Actinomycetes bacterium]